MFFSLCEDDSNVSKLILLKPFQSQQIITHCYRQVKGRFRLEFLTFVTCQTEHAPKSACDRPVLKKKQTNKQTKKAHVKGAYR